MPKNIFYSEKERELFISINKELLSSVLQQQINYYAISNNLTEANIYGESDSKIYNNPIQFWALIQYEQPQSQIRNRFVDFDYNIEVRFLRKYLEESNRTARSGDMIQFGNVLYEVINIIDEKLIVGQPIEKWDITCKCKATTISISDLRINIHI